MEQAEKVFLDQARGVLERIVAEVPALTLKWDVPTYNIPPEVRQLADFTVEIQHDNHVYTVVAECKAHGYPQQLRQAIDQLIRYRYKVERQDQLLVVAPFITPEGAKLCRDDKVSYFDLAGNCRIAMGSLYIERTGVPNPFEKKMIGTPSLYGMRGERILRVLLTDPKKPWKVAPLAKLTSVSGIGIRFNVAGLS